LPAPFEKPVVIAKAAPNARTAQERRDLKAVRPDFGKLCSVFRRRGEADAWSTQSCREPLTCRNGSAFASSGTIGRNARSWRKIALPPQLWQADQVKSTA
jgi:hypothetical protein